MFLKDQRSDNSTLEEDFADDTGSTWTSNMRMNVHDWELQDLLDFLSRLHNFIPEYEAVVYCKSRLQSTLCAESDH